MTQELRVAMKGSRRPPGRAWAFSAMLAALVATPCWSQQGDAGAMQGPDAAHGGMPGHDMPGGDMHHEMGKQSSMEMESAFGPYAMTREGSGTSWQPEGTPMEGMMVMRGDWMFMAHGFINGIYDHQSGPCGDEKWFTESMAMLMAQRPLGQGKLGLRAMLSLDPTMGKRGYPLLFETGETANGTTPLVDRQHPHDAFMELSASYSLPVGRDSAVFVYGGLPGEPALGPSAFMHRFSGMRNPEAPLTHHWLDSTHITFGVLTLGASSGPWKLEASSFNGREPDQNRWDIETREFDSWSTRLSFNPTAAWSMQVSYGDLKSPEQLEPDVRVRRLTASATYQAETAAGPWQTTLAWGQNHRSGPDVSERLPGWLVESTLVLQDKHTLFGRFEQVLNNELFEAGSPLAGESFRIRKLSVGYIHDFARTGDVRWGVGALVGRAFAPSALDPHYGKHPTSAMVFLQGRM
ncbi:MAG: hypothetical protein ACJ8IK_03905 [Burkholderiaceae bacterium]